MAQLFQRIKEWWETADKTQRMVSLFGAAFLIGILGFTLYFASKPKMQTLFSGMSDAEKGMVQEELIKRGFSVEVSPQGDILVPDNDYHRARMALASANKLPKASQKGIGMLDSINTFTTSRQEAEKIKAAKEGELEQSISTIEGVQSALVHINFGKESAVLDEKQNATAVVNVTESSEGALGQEEGRAIARLVQNSIAGLTPTGVSVITSAGKILYDGEALNSTESLASSKMEAEMRESRRRTQELQRQLDLAFGTGNTIVDVQVALNMDKTKISKDETVRTGDAVVEEKASEKLAGAGGSAGGPAGFESNTPSAAAAIGAGIRDGSQKYDSELTSRRYPTSTTQTQIDKAAGELISLNVSVMANKAAIKDVGSLTQIVESYVGDRLGTEGFAATVTPVEFNTAAADATKKAAGEAASAARMQQIISLLPIVALVIVGFMIVKAIGKSMKSAIAANVALPGGGSMALPAGEYAAAAPAVSEGIRKVTLPGESTPRLQTGDPELDDTLAALGITELEDPTMDVASIRQKVDVPLEQIKKMAQQRPETTAMLLKTWLLEEHRR